MSTEFQSESLRSLIVSTKVVCPHCNDVYVRRKRLNAISVPMFVSQFLCTLCRYGFNFKRNISLVFGLVWKILNVEWRTNTFYSMLKKIRTIIQQQTNQCFFTNSQIIPVALFYGEQAAVMIHHLWKGHVSACFFFSKSMGNLSDVVYYSLLAAYGRMISNPVAILFISHKKSPCWPKCSAEKTKYKGFSCFSHGRSGKATEEAQLLQFLNLDKICWPPIKVNIFPKNGPLRENCKALKLRGRRGTVFQKAKIR